MSITVRQHDKLSVDEILDGVGNTGNAPSTRTLGFNEPKRVLDANSTPPATEVWQDEVALAAGVLTVDLAALVRAGLDALDTTGLKLQVCKIRALTTNLNDLTITFGAATPYPIFGATGLVILPPGAAVTMEYPDSALDVGAGAKDVDFSGTGTEGAKVLMIFG